MDLESVVRTTAVEPYIAGWLPGGGGHVLITSRERRWAEIASPVEVDVLARPELVAILQGRVAGLSGRDAGLLAARLGDLPLAVGVGVDLNSTSGYHMRVNDAATLGQTVRALRKERGLSQRDLAAMIGVSFTYVSKIENDRLDHSPSVRTLVRLAEALQVDELELMELANKVPPVISAVARSPEALRFFRRAAEQIEDPSEWQALTDFLDARSEDRQGRHPR